jgi:hypothetical protein
VYVIRIKRVQSVKISADGVLYGVVTAVDFFIAYDFIGSKLTGRLDGEEIYDEADHGFDAGDYISRIIDSIAGR